MKTLQEFWISSFIWDVKWIESVFFSQAVNLTDSKNSSTWSTHRWWSFTCENMHEPFFVFTFDSLQSVFLCVTVGWMHQFHILLILWSFTAQICHISDPLMRGETHRGSLPAFPWLGWGWLSGFNSKSIRRQETWGITPTGSSGHIISAKVVTVWRIADLCNKKRWKKLS